MRIIFTKEMSEFLYDLARNNTKILECTTSDTKSNLAKRSCWEGICAIFNARFPNQVTTDKQASEKWRAHKKEVKNAAAKQRTSVMATGNAIEIEKMQETHEKTFALIKDAINPINYSLDSDKFQTSTDHAATDEIEILPKVAKVSHGPMADLMNFKRLEHEQTMANLKQEADLIRELYELKKNNENQLQAIRINNEAELQSLRKKFAIDYGHLPLQ